MPLKTLPCGAEGPSVAAVLAAVQPGGDAPASRSKPPLLREPIHLHVKNPFPKPIWLIYNGRAEFPRVVTAVSLYRGLSEPFAYHWDFSGNADAFRIAAHADVVLRGVQFRRMLGDTQVTLSFADDLRIEGQPAEQWLGEPGLIEAHGVYQVANATLTSQRTAPSDQPAGTALHVLCSLDIDEVDLRTPKAF